MIRLETHSHMEGWGKYGALKYGNLNVSQDSNQIYYSMLSPLAKPCFPNHDVVYTMMSSASVSIEAE